MMWVEVDGKTAYLFETHTEALAFADASGGEVVRLNHWAVLVDEKPEKGSVDEG